MKYNLAWMSALFHTRKFTLGDYAYIALGLILLASLFSTIKTTFIDATQSSVLTQSDELQSTGAFSITVSDNDN